MLKQSNISIDKFKSKDYSFIYENIKLCNAFGEFYYIIGKYDKSIQFLE